MTEKVVIAAVSKDGQAILWVTDYGKPTARAVITPGKPPTGPEVMRPFDGIISHLDFDEWDWKLNYFVERPL